MMFFCKGHKCLGRPLNSKSSFDPFHVIKCNPLFLLTQGIKLLNYVAYSIQ